MEGLQLKHGYESEEGMSVPFPVGFFPDFCVYVHARICTSVSKQARAYVFLCFIHVYHDVSTVTLKVGIKNGLCS